MTHHLFCLGCIGNNTPPLRPPENCGALVPPPPPAPLAGGELLLNVHEGTQLEGRNRSRKVAECISWCIFCVCATLLVL